MNTEQSDMHVEIQTDGVAANSQAFARVRDREFIVPADRIRQASRSVRTEQDGSQVITATVWVRPRP